jgi:ribosomal protein L29
MKARDIQNLSADELAQRIRETTAELGELRLKNKSSSSVDKPIRIRHLRRDVARMKTIAHAGTKK